MVYGLLPLQELEREKHAHSVLQFQFSELKETLKQSEELLNVSVKVHAYQERIRQAINWPDFKTH